MSHDSQVAALGSSQDLAPPDTQVAAGPQSVVELVNDTATIFAKTGSASAPSDLNAFFGVPGGFIFSDPRIEYDQLSGRWFASGLSFDPSHNSHVYLAASHTSDPTQPWTVYVVKNTTGVLTDQPKLGVSSDKVVMSWDDFQGPSLILVGQETDVLEKADLLAAAQSVHAFNFGVDSTRFSVLPVQTLTPSNTEYLVYNGLEAPPIFSGLYIAVVAITGLPSLGTVAWTEAHLPIQTSVSPPFAQQAGSTVLLNTDDRRFSAASWSNGRIWTSGNDGCQVAGDTSVRSCIRMVNVSAPSGGAQSVMQDFDIGVSGAYMYYPATVQDSAGNVGFVCSYSSSSVLPGVIFGGQVAGSRGAVGPLTFLQTGIASYSDGGAPGRWGDYAGAAVDPSNPNDMWVAGELGGSANPGGWATEIGRLTYAAPTVISVSPTSGSTTGGASVVIQGAEFSQSSSVVHFGRALAAAASVQSPERIAAISPAFPPGTVDVAVTTARGTSAQSSGDRFTFATHAPPPPSSEVTISRRADGNSDLLLRGRDGSAWHAAADSHGYPFGGWESLSGGMVGAPVGTWYNGELDVFAVGNDYQPWKKRYVTGQGWTVWTPIGGRTLATASEEVTATRRGDGSIDLFIRGGDSSGWHLVTDSHGSPISGYESLGGGLAGDPSAAWANGTLFVYAVGSDQGVYVQSFTSGWSGWGRVAGNAALASSAHVSVVNRGNGVLDLLILGTDNQAWHSATDAGGNPAGWEAIGGYLLGTVWGSWQASQLDVVGVGSDHRVYGQEYAAGWHGWVLLPGGGQSA